MSNSLMHVDAKRNDKFVSHTLSPFRAKEEGDKVLRPSIAPAKHDLAANREKLPTVKAVKSQACSPKVSHGAPSAGPKSHSLEHNSHQGRSMMASDKKDNTNSDHSNPGVVKEGFAQSLLNSVHAVHAGVQSLIHQAEMQKPSNVDLSGGTHRKDHDRSHLAKHVDNKHSRDHRVGQWVAKLDVGKPPPSAVSEAGLHSPRGMLVQDTKTTSLSDAPYGTCVYQHQPSLYRSTGHIHAGELVPLEQKLASATPDQSSSPLAYVTPVMDPSWQQYPPNRPLDHSQVTLPVLSIDIYSPDMKAKAASDKRPITMIGSNIPRIDLDQEKRHALAAVAPFAARLRQQHSQNVPLGHATNAVPIQAQHPPLAHPHVQYIEALSSSDV